MQSVFSFALMQFTLERLAGGDIAQRRTLARITLTNTGDGVAGVRIYSVRLAEADAAAAAEVEAPQCLTYREADEGALRLAYRALGRLLGETT